MRRAPQIFTAAAILLALVTTWALVRPLTELQRHRRHLAELQHQIEAARETRAARAADRGRVMRLRAQARSANGAQRDAYDAEAAGIEARLGWGDPAAVRAAVRSGPLVSVSRTAPLPRDVVPTSSANADGCISCHVSIATPGFESYPLPFRTHPNLSSYVGAASPHPPSRIGCVSCHQGDGHAQTFAEAGHSTLRAAASATPAVDRNWTDVNAVNAMLPVGRIEAACTSCHAGERYQPGAPALNEAVLTLERGGCYACHEIPGVDPGVKRGPNLRSIAHKVSPEWIRRWLADPRAAKPATWMPRFWPNAATSADDQAAIAAVAEYLTAQGNPVVGRIASSSPGGDAARGKDIVESVGCLGCHVIGESTRDEASLRRTFGQPLQAIASKTTRDWLFDWVQDPRAAGQATRMPNLRLTRAEAADVATYLSTLGSSSQPSLPAPAPDDEVYRRVIRRYDPSAEASRIQQLTGQSLREFAGAAVVNALKCSGCHEIGDANRPATPTTPLPQRAVWTDADAQAVHARRAGDSREQRTESFAPDYGLSAKESARLALALTAVAGRTRETRSLSMPWHLVKVAGRTLVQERNCVGCHQIEGVGGDFVNLVAEPTLGPPLLTPEGSRVKPEWLRTFLHEPRTIRPWLSVRMPTFALADEELDTIGSYLRGIAPENPKPAPAPPGVTAAAGKELFELLKCQQCHVLGAIPKDQPTSNLAPDLRLAHERLQPEWIDAWLRNPSAILPGTRMPTFWPDYPKSFYEPLDRDAAKQVRAIREHLLTLR